MSTTITDKTLKVIKRGPSSNRILTRDANLLYAFARKHRFYTKAKRHVEVNIVELYLDCTAPIEFVEYFKLSYHDYMKKWHPASYLSLSRTAKRP